MFWSLPRPTSAGGEKVSVTYDLTPISHETELPLIMRLPQPTHPAVHTITHTHIHKHTHPLQLYAPWRPAAFTAVNSKESKLHRIYDTIAAAAAAGGWGRGAGEGDGWVRGVRRKLQVWGRENTITPPVKQTRLRWWRWMEGWHSRVQDGDDVQRSSHHAGARGGRHLDTEIERQRRRELYSEGRVLNQPCAN